MKDVVNGEWNNYCSDDGELDDTEYDSVKKIVSFDSLNHFFETPIALK